MRIYEQGICMVFANKLTQFCNSQATDASNFY